MTNENRTPAGVPANTAGAAPTAASRVPRGTPTGGQFAASAKAEATGVALTSQAPPAFDSDAAAILSRQTLLAAGEALRADLATGTSGGPEAGDAQIHAEAFWLLQRPEVPPVGETVRSARDFLHEDMAGRDSDGWTEFADNLGPYAPVGSEHAGAIADHFMLRAIGSSDRLIDRGKHEGPADYDDALLHGAIRYALWFRTGAEPDPTQTKTILDHLVFERPQQFPKPLVPREVYDEALSPDG